MPATRTPSLSKIGPTRQLTLFGKPAPVAASSSSSKKSKSSVERVYTDAILPIKSVHADLIASGKKNHEYRKYKLRPTLRRIWLYVTAPTSTLSYVMVTDCPKVPGEVCDSSGVGNDDFDKGLKESKFGYPVLGLYRLKEPLTPLVMKEKYGISVPQGALYVPKQLFDAIPLEDMEKVF